MTQREKTIIEIAEILSKDCGRCDDCEYCGQTNDELDCTELKYAQMLFDAGYRKIDVSYEMEQLKLSIEKLKYITYPKFEIPKFEIDWKTGEFKTKGD